MCFVAIKKCAGRLDKNKIKVGTPSHNGRQKDRSRYPIVPAGKRVSCGNRRYSFVSTDFSVKGILLCIKCIVNRKNSKCSKCEDHNRSSPSMKRRVSTFWGDVSILPQGPDSISRPSWSMMTSSHSRFA